MQENTPAPENNVENNVVIKGVAIEIPRKYKKATKLNDDMWTSCKFLKGVAGPGDFLIPLGVVRLINNDDTFAIIVKVINVDKIAGNGKVNVNDKE
jgi:hypothetical protein